MKLKLVVASMSVLGLVSCPVFADTDTKHKHHHHHHKMVKHHHHVRHHEEMVEHHDYKDMGALPVVEAACTISQTTMILDGTTQSMGRAMPNPCNPGWFNRLQFSGGLNVDLGKWGNRNTGYMGENMQRLSLNDAYLNMAATVNDWARAFVSLSYNTATIVPDGTGYITHKAAGEYSAAYSNNVQSLTANNTLQLEQAYATLGNFDVSPIYVQVGKQFQDFSRYEIHSMTRSMTQVMSETLATSAKIGFIVPMGFHGSVFAFDDPVPKIGQTSKPTNYGVALGFDQPNDQLGWDIGAAYLYNLIGANDVAYSVQNFTSDGGYNTRVGAVALYGDVNSGPFTLGARWTTAVQRFNALDLPKHGVADFAGVFPAGVSKTATGAKPWAAGIQAGYGFDAWGKNQNVYLGYQASRESAGMDLPKSRWLVGYGIDMWKYTNFGVEWDHDMAYSVANGGTNNNTNLVSLRAGVKFG
jgi:hypothetical protein